MVFYDSAGVDPLLILIGYWERDSYCAVWRKSSRSDSYSLPMESGGLGDNYNTVFSYLRKSRATMGKVMVSLTDESEELVRTEVDKLYYGRTGGFSIFFEHLIREYFNGQNGHAKDAKRRLSASPR